MSLEGRSQNPFGLFEVFSHQDPLVDIVFVHGLNGNPYNTWTASNNVFWPADLLPSFLPDQRCRILTYGYNANVTAFTDGASKDNILNHAENLAAHLVANRSSVLERPLLFVCHSLGGLVVKRCLILCKGITSSKTEARRSVFVSTYGIVFLGTPHVGSDLAKWGSLLQSIASAVFPKKFFDSQPQLVEALKKNNETLQNINADFVSITPKLHVYFFHESKPMDLKGTRGFIVDEQSAAPMLEGVERAGIERDHSTMCKFEDENAPGFRLVAEALNRYSRDAPATILRNWQVEKHVRDVEYRRSMLDIMDADNNQFSRNISPDTRYLGVSADAAIDADRSTPLLIEPVARAETSVSPTITPSEYEKPIPHNSLLVAPLGFRANSVFVGFSIELARLEHKLRSVKRIQRGSCTALLHGPTGCGKSHLAREFVARHRHEYPGGVFWIDCKTRGSCKKGFWDLARALECLDFRNVSYHDEEVIDAVRERLKTLDGWLLIFDGIFFRSEDALTAFQRYIPDSTGGYIIYTTVDQTLANRQRLLDPPGIKIWPLSVEDACHLLYRSLHLRGRPNALQVEKARKLVQHYGCLPLGIHAAAHMLLARDRPLEKYTPGPSDQRLLGPFLEIRDALREGGHDEALNLLILFSFLNHEAPVRLFQLGRKYLLDKFGIDIRSPDSEGGSSKRELDNSISLLIRNGFLERNPQIHVNNLEDDRSSPEEFRQQIGGGRSALKEEDSGLSEYSMGENDSSRSTTAIIRIDVIRLHTVVQNVILDDLKTIPENFHHWLAIASLFICNSYRRAFEEMQGNVLAEDLQEYQTHADKLWSHFPRSAVNAPNLLRRARHELHALRRTIQNDLRNQSSSHSSDSSHKVQPVSVFERSGSSSDDGPPTPSSDMTRVSTWSLDPHAAATESPTEEQFYHHSNLDASWHEDFGYTSDFEDHSAKRERTASSSTARPEEERRAALQAIFEGHTVQGRKRRDLGEWKPIPIIGPVSEAGPELVKSRTSSSSSARPISSGSPARDSLAAVHQMSPPTSAGPDMESPTQAEYSRTPLGELPINTRRNQETDRFHARKPSTSPRLMQAVLANNAIRNQLPIEENITVTRPTNRPVPPTEPRPQIMISSRNVEYRPMPSGYSSAPMSRDASRESNLSLQTEPVDKTFSVSPPRSYLTQQNISQVTEALESASHFETHDRQHVNVKPPSPIGKDALAGLEYSDAFHPSTDGKQDI